MAGTAHKVVSACFRVLEFGCAVIILGILARFFRIINRIGAPKDSRLEYAIAMASISVAATILLVPPLKYSFYCFPLDFALFVCWVVCFALLEDLGGTKTCSSSWFDTYWTIYWGDQGNSVIVTGAGCSKWRAVLAFSFILACLFFTSALIGFYACATHHKLGAHYVSFVGKLAWWKKKTPKEPDIEKSAPRPEETQRLPDVASNGDPNRE